MSRRTAARVAHFATRYQRFPPCGSSWRLASPGRSGAGPSGAETVRSSIDMQDLFHQTWDVAVALWPRAQEVAQFSGQLGE